MGKRTNGERNQTGGEKAPASTSHKDDKKKPGGGLGPKPFTRFRLTNNDGNGTPKTVRFSAYHPSTSPDASTDPATDRMSVGKTGASLEGAGSLPPRFELDVPGGAVVALDSSGGGIEGIKDVKSVLLEVRMAGSPRIAMGVIPCTVGGTAMRFKELNVEIVDSDVDGALTVRVNATARYFDANDNEMPAPGQLEDLGSFDLPVFP